MLCKVKKFLNYPRQDLVARTGIEPGTIAYETMFNHCMYTSWVRAQQRG